MKKTEYDIIEYNSVDDACDAVNDGAVDAFATGTYVAKAILQSPRYKQLDIKEFDEVALPCGLAIHNDSILESALNKGIQLVTEEERRSIIRIRCITGLTFHCMISSIHIVILLHLYC